MSNRGKFTIPRTLELRHLPFFIPRKPWIQAVTLVFSPLLLAMALFSLWMVIFGPNELASRVGSLLFSVIFLMASFLAFDRSLGYKVVIHANGLMIQGMLFSRLILWDEIIAIKAQPNYRFPGYYASVTVDGSRNPRRHWSSLWFGFYDIASHMQLGGEELARLFRHAKRRAESGWTNTRGPAIQKPVKKTRNEVTPI